MNKSAIFTKAHQIAKATVSVVGNYRIAFSLALKEVYAEMNQVVKVEKVIVHWSESNVFGRENDKEFSFDEFERLATANASTMTENDGYDKTKFSVVFTDGEVYSARLDIEPRTPNLTTHVRKMRDYRTEQGNFEEVEAYNEILEAFKASR